MCKIHREKFPQIPRRTIQYHAKIWANRETFDKRHANGGKPEYHDLRDKQNPLKSVKFFVAISYGYEVIMCKKWDNSKVLDGKNNRNFIEKHWLAALQNSSNPHNKLILQEGYPVQESKQAQYGYNTVGCEILSIHS